MGILDTQCVYNLIGRLNYSKTKIDDALSETSVNAVQNKVLTPILEALQSKAIINITETVELKDLEEGVYQVTNGGEVWFCPLGTTENQITLRDGYLVYQYGAVAAMGITTQGFDIFPDVLGGTYANGVYYIYSLFHEVNDKLPKAGGTLNGNINMNNYDINNIDRAFITNYLGVGDVSSGLKFISNEETNTILGLTTPESNTAAANKEYVDNQDATKLSLTGGTMTGNLDMGTHNINNIKTISINKNGTVVMGVNSSIEFENSDGYIKGLKLPVKGNYAASKNYVDNVFSALNYTSVTLLDTTLSSQVSSIKINQYNGADFRCREYCALLEIPKTSSAVEIMNSIGRAAGTANTTVNVRPIYTTTQSSKKVLVYIKYKQNSNVYWTSESGSLVVNASGTGTTWSDNYAAVQTFPMGASASGFDTNGIGFITFYGTFPAGTKITVWGDIQQ